jgi:hypothetical protein
VKMRRVVLSSRLDEHPDDNPEESRNLWHYLFSSWAT